MEMDEGEIIVPDKVTLTVVEGENKGQVYPVNLKTITIGRAEGCDIRLADQYVSKKHCQIVFRGDHFTVIDLQSLNKTRVNGNMYIQKNLKNNAVIRVGKTELKFGWDGINEALLNEEDDIPVPEDDSALNE
jgi:pSer/pThr/pTyr-binding forkhead associated (FHA) protein